MLQAAAKALRTAILGISSVSNAVGTRVYWRRAAADAALPYIVIDHVGGGSTNDTARQAFDQVWQVAVVSDNAATANTIAEAVRVGLHLADLTYDAPWKAIVCQHVDPFFEIEDVDRRQYVQAGGTFRIRASY